MNYHYRAGQIYGLYISGYTYRRIGKIFHITMQRVGQILTEYWHGYRNGMADYPQPISQLLLETPGHDKYRRGYLDGWWESDSCDGMGILQLIAMWAIIVRCYIATIQ